MKAKILIVEDQFIEAHSLERILIRANYIVSSIARSVAIALKSIERDTPDLVLLDIHLQGNLTGIDLARSLSQRNIPFVYLSANSNKQVLQEAKSTKPYGFLVKPFRERDVLVMIDVALYVHRQNQDPVIKQGKAGISPFVPNSSELKSMVGKSKVMQELYEMINIVSGSDISVLICGESGTGKELIAKDIHQLSNRASGPFIVVNCSALPPTLVESELFGHEKGAFTGAVEKRTGKFEQADGGSIFLDEIGELPLEMQVRFLRVLQEKEVEPIGGKIKRVNVRVIAATNRNLEDEIAAGRFRMDLFYRLNLFQITPPPLRERRSDIPLLVKHFISIYNKQTGKNITGVSDTVLKSLEDYYWPGNVRELENVIFRTVLVSPGPKLEKVDLPGMRNGVPESKVKTMVENERDHIIAVLQSCNWKISGGGGAAELLDIHVSTLNSRIKKLGIVKP
jgi:two-component system response regulator HydG